MYCTVAVVVDTVHSCPSSARKNWSIWLFYFIFGCLVCNMITAARLPALISEEFVKKDRWAVYSLNRCSIKRFPLYKVLSQNKICYHLLNTFAWKCLIEVRLPETINQFMKIHMHHAIVSNHLILETKRWACHNSTKYLLRKENLPNLSVLVYT